MPLANGGVFAGYRIIGTLGSGETAARLSEPHRAKDFSREAFDDDRTLVAVWPRKQGSVPSETGRHSRGFSSPDGLRGV
jgi:hypothetical protein